MWVFFKGNPDLISNLWKTKRRITKLISGNNSTTSGRKNIHLELRSLWQVGITDVLAAYKKAAKEPLISPWQVAGGCLRQPAASSITHWLSQWAPYQSQPIQDQPALVCGFWSTWIVNLKVYLFAFPSFLNSWRNNHACHLVMTQVFWWEWVWELKGNCSPDLQHASHAPSPDNQGMILSAAGAGSAQSSLIQSYNKHSNHGSFIPALHSKKIILIFLGEGTD